MNSYLLIYIFLSLAVWAIVPIRQIRQKYFMFFLILISGDLITLVCRYAFHSRTNVFFIIANLLCLISIQQKKNSTLFRIMILVLTIATIIVEYFNFGYKDEFILICFTDFLLFYKFSHFSMLKFAEEKVISLFLVLVAFDELISVTKFVGFITDAASATVYFEIVTALQVLIGFFFCIYKESDTRLLIKFK